MNTEWLATYYASEISGRDYRAAISEFLNNGDGFWPYLVVF